MDKYTAERLRQMIEEFAALTRLHERLLTLGIENVKQLSNRIDVIESEMETLLNE